MTDQTYFENGRERYSDTGSLVWPRRYRELADMRTGLPKGSLKEDDFVLSILARLDELEVRTRSGADPAGKDLAAMNALNFAAWLTDYVAGWAIDHQLGLAQNNLRFVPLQPSQTKKHPEYLDQRAKVDSHDHELAGGRIEPNDVSPAVARHFVRNVLSAMNSRLRLPVAFIEALDALDFGETQPILREVDTATRLGLRELRLKLFAVMYIEYHNAASGTRRHRLHELVADKFAVSHETVRGWSQELRKALGDLEVARSVAFAQNWASNYVADLKRHATGELADPQAFASKFSVEALIAAGKKYQQRNK